MNIVAFKDFLLFLPMHYFDRNADSNIKFSYHSSR